MGDLSDATIDAFLAAVTDVARATRAAPSAERQALKSEDARRALPLPRWACSR